MTVLSSADGVPTVYSMWACPYAQRTRILLTLKGIEHKVVEIDLTKPRPDWFRDLNPAGKVPVFQVKTDVVTESSVINEYLEEVYPRPAAMPDTPLQRARARLLVDFCNTRFAPNMYRVLMEQNDSRRERMWRAAESDWMELEQLIERFGMQKDSGSGGFGIIEATFAPFFARYVLTDYYWGFQPWKQGGLAGVLGWRDAMLGHEAVKATALPETSYIKLYEDYAYGCSNGKVPPGRLRSSFDMSLKLDERPMPARRVQGNWAV